MRIDVIDNVKAINELRAEWDAVYDADPEAQFFLSPTWLFKWHAEIENPPTILAAKPDDGSSGYVGFFPLWLKTKERKSGGFFNDINIGGNYMADYTGFLCRPEFEVRAIPAFARAIKQLNWTHFRIEYFCASERRTALLLDEFSKSEFEVEKLDRFDENKVDLSICPFAQLPGDWDAYLDRLSANTRQKIRRVLRQIEKSDEFRITQANKDTIDGDIDILLRFWKVRWGALKGKRIDGILKTNRMMLRHCFETGVLFLPILWHGDRPVCALATLVDDRKKSFLFYMAGRDPTYDGPPPGLVLHAHSIRHAIGNGIVTYDFLRGNEPYKYSFGVEERRIATFALTTKDGKNLGGKLDRRSLAFALRRSKEHHRAGRHAEAGPGYRQVLELDPRNAEALYGLGQILAKQGEHAAAIKLFQTLVADKPGLDKVWFRLGRSLQAHGDLPEAADAYCESLERQPANASAYFGLGHVLLKIESFDLAVAAFEAARALQADYPGIDDGLMKVLHLRGGLSPREVARRAALHAEVRDRVGKLSAIAAAAARNRQGANDMLVVETDRIERPFPLRIAAESIGRAGQHIVGDQADALDIYRGAITRELRQG